VSFPEESVEQAAILYRALGNRLRLEILMCLEQGPACVHELVERVEASQPLVSQHLRVLKSVNAVRSVRSGKEMVYQIADEHIAHIVRDGVQHIEEKMAWVLTHQLRCTTTVTVPTAGIQQSNMEITWIISMMVTLTLSMVITMTSAQHASVPAAMTYALRAPAVIVHVRPATMPRDYYQ
jgi:DNA-binding transcriptional ArsR family regulator